MLLFPAIDLLNGHVVRLKQGDYRQITVFSDDPLAQARTFADAGAQYLHLVDLNGAHKSVAASTTPAADNRMMIRRLIAQSGLKVEVGGGIRSLADIEDLAQAGANRIIIGTALLSNPEMVASAIDRFGDLLCAAIDARDGKVALAGWTETSTVDVADLALRLADQGMRHFLYTDISRDGLKTGIDAQAYRRLAATIKWPLIASGGIASLDDLRALKALGTTSVEAVIVGRALYEQAFTVEQALAVLST
jgi:phosphoribosylformimino-5-aminoimidazole carboxamide ribotide isomerase